MLLGFSIATLLALAFIFAILLLRERAKVRRWRESQRYWKEFAQRAVEIREDPDAPEKAREIANILLAVAASPEFVRECGRGIGRARFGRSAADPRMFKRSLERDLGTRYATKMQDMIRPLARALITVSVDNVSVRIVMARDQRKRDDKALRNDVGRRLIVRASQQGPNWFNDAHAA
ncbi:hypothetical protein [Tistlia consotensis]|uniref:hypothetical protein n=1 Tax=Tistlia consotensis TaxID=1321365 RepID=UPI00117C9F50|nr:hypothetical protein [Tistlia consotensis]